MVPVPEPISRAKQMAHPYELSPNIGVHNKRQHQYFVNPVLRLEYHPGNSIEMEEKGSTMKKYEVSRREFINMAAGAAVGASGLLGGRAVQAAEAETLRINVAGYAYDRVRAIMDGQAGIEGAEVKFGVEDIYKLTKFAFGPERKYEVTELGLIPFIANYINNGFRDYTLIPVFISRTFRHRNVFVHVDSGIDKPEDLRGKRVGTHGYGMSANTWIRGFLLD